MALEKLFSSPFSLAHGVVARQFVVSCEAADGQGCQIFPYLRTHALRRDIVRYSRNQSSCISKDYPMLNTCDQYTPVSLTRAGNGRYTGAIEDTGNGIGPCATAAAMLSAALDRSAAEVVPVSITTYFVSPRRSGPCDVGVKWVRGNGSIQCWQGELRQDGVIASSQIVLTGDLPSSSYVLFDSGFENQTGGVSVLVESTFSALARALTVSPRDLIGEDCEPCSVAIRFYSDVHSSQERSGLSVEHDVPLSSGEVMTCDVRLVGPSGPVAAATYVFLRSVR